MSPPYYVPSGKYPPEAPARLSRAVFLSTAVTGALYGWLSSEFFVLIPVGKFAGHHVDVMTSLLFGILPAALINGCLTSICIRKLRLRNPEMARKLTIRAAALGWSVNWLALYASACLYAGFDGGFLHFFFERLTQGIPAKFVYGRSHGSVLYYTAQWYLLLPAWAIEGVLVPYCLGGIAAIQAGRPFSEITNTWYHRVTLPFPIFRPSPKKMEERLEQEGSEALLSAWPAKYKPQSWSSGGWAKMVLFIPDRGGSDIYATVGVYEDSVLNGGLRRPQSAKVFSKYFTVSEEEAQVLIERLGGPKMTG